MENPEPQTSPPQLGLAICRRFTCPNVVWSLNPGAFGLEFLLASRAGVQQSGRRVQWRRRRFLRWRGGWSW